jgi:DNA-binding transcriptional LysR family regulator
VVAQYDLLKERYIDKEQKIRFGVSTQHYTFAVKSYIELISNYGTDKYDFSIYEGKTSDVINDVRTFRSEIGIIHMDEYNSNYLLKYLKANNLQYHKLFDCKVYAYLSSKHPLAGNKKVTEKELEPFPCLTFTQGEGAPIYLSEEPVSMFAKRNTIRVSDRGTMLNLMVGLNGYTLCSGIICEELNGSRYTAIPYDSREKTSVIYITRDGSALSELGEKYIEHLRSFAS